MRNDLTIIIPCKNEEKYIGNCLESIYLQNGIGDVNIIISDAGSSDNTINIIINWSSKLKISIIKGGLPAIGRNSGALVSNTKYLLFIDSDVEFYDRNLISNSIELMKNKNLDLLSPKLSSKNLIVRFLYKITNIIIHLSKYDSPFAVGMFMMMRKDCFDRLGGFPEDVMHCEDYLLSKKVNKDRFGIIKSKVYSDNRRFKKMGYINMIFYIFKNIINRNNYDYFKKDINYWI